MGIIETIVSCMALLILFASALFGEFCYFRKGRPGYYQFASLMLIACPIAVAYDILTYSFFSDAWSGFTLSVFSRIGIALFSLGLVSEVFSFLKKQGADCSLNAGFGLAASLTALIPIVIKIIFFIATAMIDPDLEDVIFIGITTVVECLSVYPAALIAFKRKNDGLVGRFRFACLALIIFWVISQILTYTMFIGGIAFLVLDLALAMSGALLVVGLERGCRK